MDTQSISSETKTFFPSARRTLLWGAVFGFIASVVLVFFFWAKGGLKGHPEILIISVCMFPFAIALMYLRFLLGSSAKIEISPTGITNTMRSGKAYPILWDEVTSVNHEIIGHQESFAIKTSTKHRIYFTHEGLSASEWKEICKLIEHYTANKK